MSPSDTGQRHRFGTKDGTHLAPAGHALKQERKARSGRSNRAMRGSAPQITWTVHCAPVSGPIRPTGGYTPFQVWEDPRASNTRLPRTDQKKFMLDDHRHKEK